MKYFTLRELYYSYTADCHNVSNVPKAKNKLLVDAALTSLVHEVLDPLRQWLRMPITVNSGFRSKIVNEMLNGSYNSSHLYGEAADIIDLSRTFDAWQLAHAILMLQLPVDQVIVEKGCLHVSHIGYDARERGKEDNAREYLYQYRDKDGDLLYRDIKLELANMEYVNRTDHRKTS